MIEDIINSIIDCLEEENENRKESYDDSLIDVPFYTCTLNQDLLSTKYSEFLKDMNENEFDMTFVPKENEFGHDSILINFYNPEKGILTYNYRIVFRTEGRYYKYCECEYGDKDYDARYGCCGHGCDWYAPSFFIVKEILLGESSFEGDQHDFWDIRDKYYNIDVEQKEKEMKLKRIESLKETIEYCKSQIRELEE